MVSIIIPFNSIQPDRIKVFDWICQYYMNVYVECEIIIGKDNSGKEMYCKANAINNAVKLAKYDILMIADADTFLPKYVFDQCISEGYLDQYSMIIPFGVCADLNEEITKTIINGQDYNIQKYDLLNNIRFGRDVREERLAGGIHILLKDTFEASGGYDERFIGWGCEDYSFCRKIKCLFGEYKMLDDQVIYHLYHHNERVGNNYSLLQEYDTARDDKELMKSIIRASKVKPK